MTSIADELVGRFILRDFREGIERSSSDEERHLAECAEAAATHIEGENGFYGCDTGCEYATLTAKLTCPHGYEVEHEYGEFGEIADILHDIQLDERRL